MVVAQSSWIPVSPDSDFSIANLPFGVVSFPLAANNKNNSIGDSTTTPLHSSTTPPRCATRVGDTVVDLSVLSDAGLLDGLGLEDENNVFAQPTLNAFVAHERPVWRAVRHRLHALLVDPASIEGDGSVGDHGVTPHTHSDNALSSNTPLRHAALHSLSTVHVHLPLTVGDYTDGYASRTHATNVGTLFRGPDHALPVNWLHLPVAYHGRASTVCVSGTPVRRPWGQIKVVEESSSSNHTNPTTRHAPTRQLDFELEVATIVGGRPAPPGTPLSLARARDRIFGYALLNDWSARDVQAWEYVPLGPFGSKQFATTLSAWIVTVDALEPVQCGPSLLQRQPNDPVPLPYLTGHGGGGGSGANDKHGTHKKTDSDDNPKDAYDVPLQVHLQSSRHNAPRVTVCANSNFSHLYWSTAQQLVHHSVTGCVLQPGDLVGSGTISGATPQDYGSLLELSWRGTKPVSIGEDETRTFLCDGDTVTLTGSCRSGGVGFGECVGMILPAFTAAEMQSGSVYTNQPSSGSVPTPRYQNLRLYSYWQSSASWRVRIALAAKGLDCTIVPVNLSQREHQSPAYLAKNPHGQVPLLECTDGVRGTPVYLAQSLAVVQFLDDAFPHTRSLLPRDPLDRAAAMEMVHLICSGTQPLQNSHFLARLETASGGTIDGNEIGREVVERGLTAVEALVVRRRNDLGTTTTATMTQDGPYSLGTFAPTLVDICVVPQLYNAVQRFRIDVKAICPTLVQIEALCSQHAWFQAAHPDAQPDAPARNA